jgi:4-carboxymuconolactone decarboxylase
MKQPTPRLPLVGSDDSPETDALTRAIFERVEASTGRVPNLYRNLANAPELLDAWINFAWPLRHAANSDRRVRELVIMRTAQLNAVDYEWRQHWRMATAEGVPVEQLEALADWRESDLFSPSERAALAVTDELADGADLSDAVWDSLQEQFDPKECLEIVLTASFYACVSRVLGALRVPLEDSATEVPGLRPA